MKPVFSIIIPVYNRRHLVSVAIDSALAQDYDGEFEILVGDDGSTDGSAEFIEQEYGSRVTVLRQANAGPGPARNLAASQARGDYLALLDSDDAFMPWALTVYAELIREHDRPSLIVGAAKDWRDMSRLPEFERGPASARWAKDLFTARLATPIVATDRLAVRRDAFERLGGFTDKVRNGEDLDFCARAGVEPGFVAIDSPITFVRRYHDQQITGDPRSAYEGRMFLLDQEGLGVYPGGEPYRWLRREFLSFWGRAASAQMLRHGRADWGWEFYRRLFPWHVRLMRWKYLLGYPLMWMRSRLRGAKRPTA